MKFSLLKQNQQKMQLDTAEQVAKLQQNAQLFPLQVQKMNQSLQMGDITLKTAQAQQKWDQSSYENGLSPTQSNNPSGSLNPAYTNHPGFAPVVPAAAVKTTMGPVTSSVNWDNTDAEDLDKRAASPNTVDITNYSSTEPGADSGTKAGKGAWDNQLQSGSLALNQGMISKLGNPPKGAIITYQGQPIGAFHDKSPQPGLNVDVYDPTGKQAPFLKGANPDDFSVASIGVQTPPDTEDDNS